MALALGGKPGVGEGSGFWPADREDREAPCRRCGELPFIIIITIISWSRREKKKKKKKGDNMKAPEFFEKKKKILNLN